MVIYIIVPKGCTVTQTSRTVMLGIHLQNLHTPSRFLRYNFTFFVRCALFSPNYLGFLHPVFRSFITLIFAKFLNFVNVWPWIPTFLRTVHVLKCYFFFWLLIHLYTGSTSRKRTKLSVVLADIICLNRLTKAVNLAS